MKRLLVILGCVIAFQFATSDSLFAHKKFSRHGSFGVSFGVFYDALSPHGEWITVGSGVYGWRPMGVAVGWRPYTVGRWCWTDDGWYWLSDEPWGWASYHYGRWTYDDYYGWIWIPGYDWAPAWVEWRYGGDYVGWAPLSPYAVFSISWGIHYRTRWNTPHHWWNFVDCGYIATPNVHRYVYRNNNNTRYIGVTRSGGSVRYNEGRIVTRGPEREYVERRGNVRVEPVRIREVEDRAVERVVRDDNRERIEVYRPRIESGRSDEGRVERPARVREESGRTLDIDTRKIDLRAREVAREEGRDFDRAREYRQREESGRSNEPTRSYEQQRDENARRQADDAAMRSQQERSRERIERSQPRNEGTYDRPREDRGRTRERQPEVRPEGRPERQPQKDVERRREEPRREQFKSPAPERRIETPRMESPRNSGGERREGGRSGRGR